MSFGRQPLYKALKSRFRVWVLVAGMALCTPVAAVPESFALGDDGAGPTCANYVTMGDLEWTRSGGDWVDRNGLLHGDRPFAMREVPKGDGRQEEAWDITELVRGWIEGRYPNDGLLLRAIPGTGNGTVNFFTREAKEPASRPLLTLTWHDGSVSTLTAIADSYLTCSSRASKGEQTILKVNSSQSGFLRFALSKDTKTTLRSATVRLVSGKRYANSVEIGVFRIAPPYARVTGPPAAGLAKDFPGDEGIEKSPDVLFSTGFENSAWISEWTHYGRRSTAEAVAKDAPGKFEPLAGRALRVRFVKGQNLGLDLRYEFAKKGRPEPEEIYFRYYLRFADDWNPSRDGGKMPGIAGTYGEAGWGMRRSDGYNGWSVRGSFAARPSAASVEGMTTIGSYAYHAQAESASGEHWPWSAGPSGLLQNNRWYAVEQYVKLNTPGMPNGVFRAWINGRLVEERSAVLFRNTPDLKIESVWMNVYHGGVAPAPHDMTLYIDNVVVARRYIGPVQP